MKMLLRSSIIPALLLLLSVETSTARRKYVCPIGYSLAHNKFKDDEPKCYRRKGPEFFNEKFTDCPGNLYTSRLYHSLNIPKSDITLWTDYKSTYEGGIFVDWSYTESMGDVLTTAYNVVYDPRLGLDDELCVVIDPVTNFTAVRCHEQYYRYCIVDPLEDDIDDMETTGCDSPKDFGYVRFWSPVATCLTAVTPARGGKVRSTWRQAQKQCAERNGTLLSKGWRYASSPLYSRGESESFPLGIVLSADNRTVMFSNENITIPTSEWHFEVSNVTSNTSLGALRDDFWYMVNSSFTFFNVICERSIELTPISMTVSVLSDGKLVLQTNVTVDENNIYCMTDSIAHYPSKVDITYDRRSDFYVLKPESDGYYWCVHVDSKSFLTSESNKTLYVRIKDSLVNVYAVKLYLNNTYNIDSMKDLRKELQSGLAEYIYYRTKYVEDNFEDALDQNTTEVELRNFKNNHRHLDWRDRDVVQKLKLKRLYLDRKTVLVHLTLGRGMKPVFPGTWGNMTVEFMKPVYYCPNIGGIPLTPIDNWVIVECTTHKCVGDYNEGVQWVSSAIAGCTTTVRVTSLSYPISVDPENIDGIMPTIGPIISSTLGDREFTDLPATPPSRLPVVTTDRTPEWDESGEEEASTQYTTDFVVTVETTTKTETVSTVTWPTTSESVSTAVPTFPTLLPEDQLQQVMSDLEDLLHDSTGPVFVSDIEPAFKQVDSLLDTEQDLPIPGELLNLLDEVGSRIDLNGSREASTVRRNIAILVADSEPDYPVRGLQIAATDDDGFIENSFQLIDAVNSTHLNSNTSEAVVHLPESVANSQRRISFIIFRNDRAFQNNRSFAVNSRVLSIKVENVTEFDHGEVIDIHLNPLTNNPERNQSRACAFWHFTSDGSGYWSQDGCTFIKSTEEGVLDTCRCVHLTHFAEVLIPRTMFSQRHEDALEIISIVGCLVSLLGLALIGLTAIMFRTWRRDYSNKIWLQLCLAIFLLVTCFLVIVFAKFDHYNVPCMLIGILLHYSVLASFCWMLVAAVLSYRRLVIIFTRDASHKLLRACAFSWGIPCAVVGILLSVAPHSYEGRFDELHPTGSFCYPSGLALYLTLYVPIGVIMIANWTLFGLIVRSVFASRRIQRHGDSNEALRCASVSCLLVFLFGLPWALAWFAFNIVAAYIFSLIVTLQGFVLFLFFVVGNKKTRDLWLNKLKIKQTRKVPVTSSTITNRSIGYRGGPQGPSTIEVNSTKPKSLTSPDNSRFS